LYDTTAESTLDAQGRIALAANQLGIAGIKSAITLIGHETHIELWEPSRYAAYLENDTDFDTIFFQSVQAGLLKK
jgi:DNA-binding transcriptional regulator/RsmH inhibitor MraZ